MQLPDRGRRLFRLKAYSANWPEPSWNEGFKKTWIQYIIIVGIFSIFMTLLHRNEPLYFFLEYWREFIWFVIFVGICFSALISVAEVADGNSGRFGYQFEIRARGFEAIIDPRETFVPTDPPFYFWTDVKRVDYVHSADELRMTITGSWGEPSLLITIYAEQVAEFGRFKELDEARLSSVLLVLDRWRSDIIIGEPNGSGVFEADKPTSLGR